MHDRQKVEAILTRRFAGASREQIAVAANALMGLQEEWEEVISDGAFGCHCVVKGAETCVLTRSLEDGTEFRLLRRCAPDPATPKTRQAAGQPGETG